MTDLEKLKNWISTFPGFDILSQFNVDYTDQIPANGGIYPTGLVEIIRTRDITGDTVVRNQYNFGLYYVFLKAQGDDNLSSDNADWIIEFQKWVQEQSVLGKAPVFGNYKTNEEQIKAQNGVLYSADEEGTATYMVQLSVEFYKRFKGENKWQI